MNGYELCRQVKQDAKLKRIPLILLSTLGDPQDIIEGLQAGADNYVTKPYETEYLLSRIDSLLQTPIVDTEAGRRRKSPRSHAAGQTVLRPVRPPASLEPAD